MKMKKNIGLTLLIFLLIKGSISCAQNITCVDSINWNNLTSFKLYKYQGDSTEVLFNKDLSNNVFDNFKEIPIDKCIELFKIAINTKSKSASFSGNKYGLLEFKSKKVVKIKISEIGFRNKSTREYFIFPENAKKEWNILIR